MSASSLGAGRPLPANYKWVVLSNTTIGMLFATINASILLIAERLDVPFIDRAIPLAVADRLHVPYDDAAAHDEHVSTGWLQRVLSGFVGGDSGPPAPLPAEMFSSEDFRRATEEVLLQQAATGSGVILGRGAVVVLREDPRALRVRLDGPAERRVSQAMRLDPSLDRKGAERVLRQFDRTHAAYLQQLYGVDIRDSTLYHLALDSTCIELDACVEIIARAARALGAGARTWATNGSAITRSRFAGHLVGAALGEAYDVAMTALGVSLLFVGALLILLEAHVPTLGVLGGPGVLLLGAGAVLAVLGLGGGIVLGVVAALLLAGTAGAVLAVTVGKGVAVRRRSVRAGPESLIGHLGVVRSWSGATGSVLVDGALWRARRSMLDDSEEPAELHPGDEVVVDHLDGLTVRVRRAEEWELIQ